jgi:hypothetical protein
MVAPIHESLSKEGLGLDDDLYQTASRAFHVLVVDHCLMNQRVLVVNEGTGLSPGTHSGFDMMGSQRIR